MIEKAKGGDRIQGANLESLLGKFNHAATIINEGQFFLNRLKYRFNMMNKNWTQHSHLHDSETKDLQIWIIMLFYLKEGSTGRSFNHTLSEQCHQSSAFQMHENGEWAFTSSSATGPLDGGSNTRRPPQLLHNMAAFWTLKTPAEMKDNSCFLSVTNSKNTMYWLGKKKHNPILFPLHDILARECRKLCMKTNCSSEKIHVSGDKDLVSD
jgi:hypothetical protein